MSGHFRNTLNLYDPEYQSGSGNKTNLSIEFIPGGFVFSLLDADKFRYVALEEYLYEGSHPQNGFFDDLPGFASNHPVLSGGFDKVSVSHYSPRLVLTPEDLFKKSEEKNIYGLACPFERGDRILSDHLNILKAYATYAVPESMIMALDDIFGNYRIRHYGTVLIESSLASQKLDRWNASVVLHIRRDNFEILLFDGSKLLYYHSFKITCFDDMLYYIFYVLEQYRFKASRIRAVVLGKMAMDSVEFDMLSKVFKSVLFPERNDMYQYCNEFDSIPYHFYFNNLSLNLCG